MNVTGPLDRPIVPASIALTPPARPGAQARAQAGARPPGAEPAEATFWDLLTSEEREFFALESARGPLTYGPPRRAAAAPATPTGGRLDVRG